jgi:hypothetical protein
LTSTPKCIPAEEARNSLKLRSNFMKMNKKTNLSLLKFPAERLMKTVNLTFKVYKSSQREKE